MRRPTTIHQSGRFWLVTVRRPGRHADEQGWKGIDVVVTGRRIRVRRTVAQLTSSSWQRPSSRRGVWPNGCTFGTSSNRPAGIREDRVLPDALMSWCRTQTTAEQPNTLRRGNTQHHRQRWSLRPGQVGIQRRRWIFVLLARVRRSWGAGQQTGRHLRRAERIGISRFRRGDERCVRHMASFREIRMCASSPLEA